MSLTSLSSSQLGHERLITTILYAVVDAAFGEILTTCEKLRWTIANGQDCLKPDYRSQVFFRSSHTDDSLTTLPPCSTNLLLAHKVSKVVYEPLGVVAAIVSWNYPIHNALSPIIAALFSGNAIVVKPSENVAWSSLHIIEAVRACLAACGEVSSLSFPLLACASPRVLTDTRCGSKDSELVQIAVTLPDSVEALTGDPRIKHITFVSARSLV